MSFFHIAFISTYFASKVCVFTYLHTRNMSTWLFVQNFIPVADDMLIPQSTLKCKGVYYISQATKMCLSKLAQEHCLSKGRWSHYERLILFKEHHIQQGLWQTLNPYYITLRHLRPLPVSTPPLVTYPRTPPPPPRPQHMPNTPTPVLTFPNNNLGIGVKYGGAECGSSQ